MAHPTRPTPQNLTSARPSSPRPLSRPSGVARWREEASEPGLTSPVPQDHSTHIPEDLEQPRTTSPAPASSGTADQTHKATTAPAVTITRAQMKMTVSVQDQPYTEQKSNKIENTSSPRKPGDIFSAPPPSTYRPHLARAGAMALTTSPMSSSRKKPTQAHTPLDRSCTVSCESMPPPQLSPLYLHPSRLSPGPRSWSSDSLIFERNVQESVQSPASPATPSHIATEKYIPSVLSASSEAIVNKQLDPDSVEIISHAPADEMARVAAILHPASCDGSPTDKKRWLEDDVVAWARESSGPQRYLSFISFADLVQAEQTSDEHMEAPTHCFWSGQGLPTPALPGASSHNIDRRALLSSNPSQCSLVSVDNPTSTMRSPSQSSLSSAPPAADLPGAACSPTSSGRFHTPLLSPFRYHSSSTSQSGSRVTIETLRQALRRTASCN